MKIGKPVSLTEFELIRQIQQQVGPAEHLVLGIGDDCAIQRQTENQQLLTSTDLLIEGVHFDLRWTSLEELGRKSVAVNVSDIAAMGGTPQSLFLGVACPQRLSSADLQQFTAGFLSEAGKYSVVLAGGDTCRSPGPLLISVTVQGCCESGRAILRSGAAVGDAIYVSGTLGDSALALQQLQRGETPPAQLALRHHRPQARVALGAQLARQQLASAMLDVSDGLLGDLEHILAASAVGAIIELDRIPLSDAFRAEQQRNPRLLDLALTGGEDYELLFTSRCQDLDQRAELSPAVTRVGSITVAPGIQCRQADGSLYQCQRGGYDHFA
ncbi:MAG TPA: thiamine-phosphate kinase [Malonomonas sp.]